MLLAELHDHVMPLFPYYAQKDLGTAVRVLAAALQCRDPEHCPPEQYHRPLPTLYHLLETYLLQQGKSAHTLRNIKNNLSRFFRVAESQHLLTLPPLVPTPRYALTTRPVRPGSSHTQKTGYYHCSRDWSPTLQTAYAAFETWATSTVCPGRDARWKKRPITLQSYRKLFEAYFGFLLHFRNIPEPTFDHLFDFSLVHAFIQWHVNECHHRSTYSIRNFIQNLATITRQYRPLPEFRTQLLALRRTLPVPTPTYNKTDAWVSLATLRQIGLTLWPHKRPEPLRKHHTGARHALYAGLSLMLQLWTFIPYRQRNIRELQLRDNLYKNPQGKWHIVFRGEQLKIASRRGSINCFDLPFPEPLVATLEAYLHDWRPRLTVKSQQQYPHLFLNMHGKPYIGQRLEKTTSDIIYTYTGQYWHPHIIRTVWATEWIRQTHGDFYTAAVMLNDTLETVIASYAYLLEENVAENAYRLIEERNSAQL